MGFFLFYYSEINLLALLIDKTVLPTIRTLNGKINNKPNKRTIPKSKKIVKLLGTTIFFIEYVGILLINNIEITINTIGVINL